jgi:hypothetical protein
MADLQKAIQRTNQLRQEFSHRWFAWSGAGLADDRQYRALLREYDHDLAVMYHHRGEVYEKLKDTTHAEADLHRSLELGFDPAKGVY